MIQTAIESAIGQLIERGYREIREHNGLRRGVRVRHAGEQYPSAYRNGTATVVGVFQRSPSSWEKSYGRPDIEVVVRHDGERGPGPWADYATEITPAREDTP